jgi:hypothetical protein
MLTENAINLEQALGWLKIIISGRLQIHFKQAEDFKVSPLSFYSENSWFAKFFEQHNPL